VTIPVLAVSGIQKDCTHFEPKSNNMTSFLIVSLILFVVELLTICARLNKEYPQSTERLLGTDQLAFFMSAGIIAWAIFLLVEIA
jgi:hypothetical protein